MVPRPPRIEFNDQTLVMLMTVSALMFVQRSGEHSDAKLMKKE
jgi:hypothetical protein